MEYAQSHFASNEQVNKLKSLFKETEENDYRYSII